jgi:N-acyl-phosphatidylethanolamine-hydrolysing phospholipase D
MAGDTGFGPHFAAIADALGPLDVAAVPVGAYSPRWFMREQHIGPDDAVRAARILGARTLLPIHWGTYRLTDEPLDEPPRMTRLEAERAGQHVALVRPGGSWTPAELRGSWPA